MRIGILGIAGMFMISIAAWIKAVFGFVTGQYSGIGVMQGIALMFIGAGFCLWGIGAIMGGRNGKRKNGNEA